MKGKKEKANETNRPKSPSHVLTARIYISIKIPSRPCETWDGRKRAKLERERERRLVARHRSHGGFGCNKVPWKSFVFLGTHSFNFDRSWSSRDSIFSSSSSPRFNTLFLSLLFFSFLFFFLFHPSRWNTRLNCRRPLGSHKKYNIFLSFDLSLSLSLSLSLFPPTFPPDL